MHTTNAQGGTKVERHEKSEVQPCLDRQDPLQPSRAPPPKASGASAMSNIVNADKVCSSACYGIMDQHACDEDLAPVASLRIRLIGHMQSHARKSVSAHIVMTNRKCTEMARRDTVTPQIGSPALRTNASYATVAPMVFIHTLTRWKNRRLEFAQATGCTHSTKGRAPPDGGFQRAAHLRHLVLVHGRDACRNTNVQAHTHIAAPAGSASNQVWAKGFAEGALARFEDKEESMKPGSVFSPCLQVG